MSDQRVIRYGDRELPLEPGMTLDQAKELMARHFPELADPAVETKKTGDKIVYVFSKRAGHKGSSARKPTATRAVARALAALRPAELVPDEALIAAEEDGLIAEPDHDPYYDEHPFVRVVRDLRDQADAAHALGTALLDLPAAVQPVGSVL